MFSEYMYSKACVKWSISKGPKIGFQDHYRLMQVKIIVECSKGRSKVLHSAIILTFIKLPFVIKTFVLSILECLFYTGFTVP